MTSLNRYDADLHHGNGEHRSTPPTTTGHTLAQHERHIYAHLIAHRQCQWFAGCTRPHVGTVDHPVLGPVPTCKECADVLGLDLVVTT